MKILAFDSTAKVASVAALEDGRVLALYNVDNGLTQSELLLPMAEAMVKALGWSFCDIELYAVTSGPGSFTGVRIGTALVKGLAFGKDIPCVSLSTIEALAENLRGVTGIIVPAMDARRGQVYSAIFRAAGGEITRLCEDMAISVLELYEKLKEYGGEPIYVVGDGYDILYKALLEKGLNSLQVTPKLLRAQNAASVGALAKRKFDNGEKTNDKNLAPTYLRMPQAERERLEKEKSEK